MWVYRGCPGLLQVELSVRKAGWLLQMLHWDGMEPHGLWSCWDARRAEWVADPEAQRGGQEMWQDLGWGC